jgi:hypothetical protein
MVRADQATVAKVERGYCIRRGGIEEAYDTGDVTAYYRPFVYGASTKHQIWGRRFILGKILSKNFLKIFGKQ